MSENLLDHLQEQGYFPQDEAVTSNVNEWFDLTVSGTGTVRLCIDPADEYRTDVHFFDGGMICEWSITASPNTPDAVIIAVLEAAERQLADRRGGPVTPAQEATTR